MAARTRGAGRDLRHGPPTPTSAPSDVVLDDGGRASFTLVTPAGHGAGDAAARRCAPGVATRSPRPRSACDAGLAVDAVAAALSAARAGAAAGGWRSPSAPDGVTVVNDAYNANPESMRAALEALVGARRRTRRTWAVLGEMRELGDAADGRARGGRPARGARSVSTGSSSSGAGARPMHAGARSTRAWAGRVGRGAGRRRRAPSCCARRCGPATSCWSRRRAAPAWSGVAAALLRRRGADGVRLILVATGVGLIIGLFGTPLPDPVAAPARLRPGDPRRRPTATRPATRPSAARRRWAASSSSSASVARLRRRPRLHLDAGPTASGLCVLFLMTGLGRRRVRRRLHQDLQAALTGLRARTKLSARPSSSLAFALLALHFPDDHGLTPGVARDLVRPRQPGGAAAGAVPGLGRT